MRRQPAPRGGAWADTVNQQPASWFSVRNLLAAAFGLYVLTMLIIVRDLPLRQVGMENMHDLAVRQLDMAWNVAPHGESSQDEFLSPVIVTGTAGTGTRVANDILEHAGGVFMGLRRNPQRDNSDFYNIVKPYVEEILQATKGDINYNIEDLPNPLVSSIRTAVKKFFDILENDAKSKVGPKRRWGFKESQAMFFMPFLYERYPTLRLVQVVRDGRDIAFSKQQRALYQEGYNRIVTGNTAPLDSNAYALAVIQTWQKINLSVMKWLTTHQPDKHTVVRLEDMCGSSSESVAEKLLFNVLGDRNVRDAGSTVDTSECRLRKYESKPRDVVLQLEAEATAGLRFFNYPTLRKQERMNTNPNNQQSIDASPHDEDFESEFDSPLVVMGSAGTGTRVASDIFEKAAGVFMPFLRNEQRDSRDFIDYVKPYVEEILLATGSNVNYKISDLPPQLVRNIRAAIERFAQKLEEEAATGKPRPQGKPPRSRAANLKNPSPSPSTVPVPSPAPLPPKKVHDRWGWKESQSMYFLPFLFERWPKMRMVHIVRDGRDMAFSNQQRATFQFAYVTIVTGTKADKRSDDYAKAVIETWQKINLGVMEYLETYQPNSFAVVRLEDLCGPNRNEVALNLIENYYHLEDRAHAAKTVALEMCRTGKFADKPKELIDELTEIARPALTKFGFLEPTTTASESGQSRGLLSTSAFDVTKPTVSIAPVLSSGMPTDEPWQVIVNRQAAKAKSGRKEIILLVNDHRYKDVFLNWLVLANHHGLENFLMIALDKATHDLCQRLGVASIRAETVISDKPMAEGASIPLHLLWEKRIALMAQILGLGVGLHMIDTDAFLLINPYPYMRPDLYDIEAMGGDFPYDMSWNTGKIGTVNCGFLRIASNNRTIAFLEAVHQQIKSAPKKDDQVEINRMLKREQVEWTAQPGCLAGFGLCHTGVTLPTKMQVNVRILDKPHFPVLASFKRDSCNTKFYLSPQNIDNHWPKDEDTPFYYTPMVVHPAGSDKTGSAKRDFFKANGLWFLNDHWQDIPEPKDSSAMIHSDYLNAIADQSKFDAIREMEAFFKYKRENPDVNRDTPCWLFRKV